MPQRWSEHPRVTDAVRWRTEHALRHADMWCPGGHWSRCTLDGNDLRNSCQLCVRWYVETLRILDRCIPRDRKYWPEGGD